MTSKRRIYRLPAQYRGRRLAFAVEQVKRSLDATEQKPKKCMRCRGNMPQSRNTMCDACRQHKAKYAKRPKE